jgi:glutaredoxin
MTAAARRLPQVTLYGRPGCCPCEEARALLERVRGEIDFELLERDIEADDALLRRYLERIPVIAIDGAERFELRVPEQALRASLAAAAFPAERSEKTH